jgi:ribose 5-phosphate isomerase A
MVVGVGTGSTVRYFIEELSTMRNIIQGAIPSSVATSELLKTHKIPILDLNANGDVDIYIDGADEIDQNKQMIKGGGGALMREKLIAACSRKFICIIDESKLVPILGAFPLPIEVLPMARSYVARKIVQLGGSPNWRQNYVTDNGNWILDIYNLKIIDPKKLEEELNNVIGDVESGMFAKVKATEIVVAKKDGTIEIIK